MKLLHTADWHIGRVLNGYSLLEEQIDVVNQIIDIAIKENVDGIIIAGDLYDRSNPSSDAISTMNELLKKINIDNKIPIYAISGNHDGSTRLNFGSGWFKKNNLIISTSIENALNPIEDEDTQIFLLPFFDPMDIRVYLKNKKSKIEKIKKIKTNNEALHEIIKDIKEKFKKNKKHVLVTHFAVTSNNKEIDLTSETISKVGGLSTISSSEFDGFDYVALGHIHTKNASPNQYIVYSGNIIKFNSKEAKTGDKGIYIVNIDKEKITKKFISIKPKRDLIVLEKEWEELISEEYYDKIPIKNSLFAIKIKKFDRDLFIGRNIRAELESIYTNIIELDYEYIIKENSINQIFQKNTNIEYSEEIVVNNFYKDITGKELSENQKKIVENTFIKLKEEK